MPSQTGEHDSANEREKEERYQSQKKVERGLTFAIAGAALAQALFAFLQWRIYKHQLKTSMPLVIIDWENMVHLSPPTPMRERIPSMDKLVHHFNWGIRNVGLTPAFITEISHRFVIVPTSQGIPKMKYAAPEPYVGEPLLTEPKPVSGGLIFYARIDDKRTYEEIEEAYRAGNETLYAFGYVRFRDRYGKKHISKFCLRYYAEKTMRKDWDGFGVAGKKQNKYN